MFLEAREYVRTWWIKQSAPLVEKSFTLYWKKGERQVIKGYTFEEAVLDAKLSPATMCNIEIIELGDKDNYVKGPISQTWVRISKPR